jgi:hypothetical protein
MSTTMDDEHASRYAAAINATLGPAGRMISASKSAYRDEHPDHLVVFNANLCLAGAKVWFGDVDLTLDEPDLLKLAAQVGEITDLLSEYDGRFQYEDAPMLEHAVYSVTPTGHTRVDATRYERRTDGRLYTRPIRRPPRWRWPRPPRLWHLWRLHASCEPSLTPQGTMTSRLLRIGHAGQDRRSPLLVLGIHHWSRQARGAWLEYTWYPSAHRAWAPPTQFRAKWHRGRVRPHLSVRLAPGVAYEVRLGVILGPTDFLWG